MSGRTFNTAGPCDPERHYMLPPEARLEGVDRLIEQASYFVVHAPRQAGKTTSVRALADRLTREGCYTALWVSCESGQAAGDDVAFGIAAVLRAIHERARFLPEPLRPPEPSEVQEVEPLSRLYVYLNRWAERSPLKVVLFLDEIDALLGSTLISVLRQLRTGFPERPARFPHSIALIGLRDVRDYRLEAGKDGPILGTSSPFNIKVESLILRDFTAVEVATLCGQHQEATGQIFTPAALDRLYELTHGQPWLVNAMARQLVEVEAPDLTQPIAADLVERAKEKLILRRDTHLDSLAARLQENRVRRVLAPFLAGNLFGPEVRQDDLDFVVDLGLLRFEGGNLVVANPIYREVIPRALTAISEASMPISRPVFVGDDGRLRFDALLEGFRAFWLEHAESMLERAPYSEAAAQLIFMAYLHKVVNGGGFIDREYAAGRGRIDLCLRWPFPGGIEKFAIELKVRRTATDVESQGLLQLQGYLERLGLKEGTLIVFDARPDAPPLPERGRDEDLERGPFKIRLLVF